MICLNHRCIFFSREKSLPSQYRRHSLKYREMEGLPNELCLLVFSYLNKWQLIESFYRLNQRFDRLLFKYLSHVYISSNIRRKDLDYLAKISSWIESVTIENQQIGREFLKKCHLENVHRIKLIDHGTEFYQEILSKYQPERFHLVITSFDQQTKPYRIDSNSLKEVQMEFYLPEYAKK